ncbi:DeoR/GlpR family DNA-binding transcription regulator [Knoellia sp. Soil729]|uniref:DeoR/GlpR family DNA-binding transcription regulator n=1 Tax=Knoellia sp. Soil729 TaxID=1736394 RepID=UPI0006F3853B|nr:DeoR/GlpR family DNA-binding transcription regulator [Knoellia sp. Soil729]KRE42713.1 alkaline phosphatase [Knoellia sp. Soil729]
MPPTTPATAEAPRQRAARLSAILDLLATEGRLSVTGAAENLEVSEATIRRDFAELARRQLVTRNHGGVVATSVAYELPYRYRASQNDSGLDRIAAATVALVAPGTVVAMNGGTTTTTVARSLTARDDLSSRGLTLVTSALNIAVEAVLRRDVRCVSLGGIPRPESYEVTGPLATAGLSQLWIDVAILGVNALSAHEGATCHHEDEAAVSRMMVERAREVIVVAAEPKLGERAFTQICEASQLTHVVTTAADADPRVADLRAAGATVHCV